MLGLLLVLFGAAWLLRESGAIDVSWQAILAGLLVVLGVGMVATAKSRGGGLVLVGIALTVALAASSAGTVDVPSFQNGIGDRTFRPAALTASTTPYSIGIGHLVIDLTDATRDLVPGSTATTATSAAGEGTATTSESATSGASTSTTVPGQKTVEASVGFGQIEIILPPALVGHVRVDSHVRWGGDIQLFGTHQGQGPGQNDTSMGPADAPLVLDLSVAGGQILVRTTEEPSVPTGPPFRGRVARAGR